VLEEGFAGRHAALAQPASRSGNGFALTGASAGGLPGNGLPGNELRADSAGGDEPSETELASRGLSGAILASDASNALDSGNPPPGGFAADTSPAGMDAPWGNGRAGAAADGSDYFARGFSLSGRMTPTADAGLDDSSERHVLAPVSDDAEPVISQADAVVSKAEVAKLGLPVRIRQASLAPQLRNSPPAAEEGGSGTAGAVAGPGTPETGSVPPGASGTASPLPPTPESALNTVSALQRGWQLGRSEGAAADPSVSVLRPRKSPSGQWFDRYDAEAGSSDADPADSADEHSSE
jgi:hypothetical protein